MIRRALVLSWLLGACAVTAAAWPAAANQVADEAAAAAAFEVTLSAPEEVAVGAMITLAVNVKNAGDQSLVVREPLFDYRSIDFRVKFEDGVESRLTRYHPRAGEPSMLVGQDLAEEGSINLEHPVPAIAAGSWRFQPIFRGARGGPYEGAWRSVQVLPLDNGASRSLLRFQTGAGVIDAALWPSTAPATALHMAGLASEGFFDGLTFHRVIQGFMIQGGCPLGNGTGDPGYTIEAEFSERTHLAGVLSMARNADPYENMGSDPRDMFRNSAGSQFFLCEADSAFLDGRYTAFGQVVSGMDVVKQIAAAPAEWGNDSRPSRPVEPVSMTRVALITDQNGQTDPKQDEQTEDEQHERTH